MLSDQLLDDLHKLNRAEKLRVVQALVNDLATEEATLEAVFPPGTSYEIWSPYDSAAAAQQLMELLEADRQSKRD